MAKRTGARGESYIEVGGEQVALLYTNRALAEVEGQIGKGVVQILTAAQRNEFAIGEVAKLAQAGMQAARRERGGGGVQMAEVWDLMDKAGMVAVLTAVVSGVTAVIGYRGGDDADPPGAPAE